MDAILFFRLGDFYEMFGQDAIEASKILGITLTARNKGENKIPMCGIPYHAAETYIAKLTRAGRKVTICEQLSDPNLPGIVDRDVVRTITPGTTFNENILDNKTNNFLISIFPKGDYFGLAIADLTTGEFKVTELNGLKNLKTEIIRLKPSECVIRKDLIAENGNLKNFLKEFEEMYLFEFEDFEDPYKSLLAHFKVKSMDGYGIERWPFGIRAAGILLNYLKNTQKNDLKHITKIGSYSTGEAMLLDESTIQNLELIVTLREAKKEGSLLGVIDKTITSMGGRLMKKWLLRPLIQKEEIEARLDVVEELIKRPERRIELEQILSRILDMERLVARLSCESGNARDLIAVKNSMNAVPKLKRLLEGSVAEMLEYARNDLIENKSLVDLIESAILDEPKLALKEGGIIKEGFYKELDDLKKISSEGKTFIQNLQEREAKRTGINSLKVRYNRVFGYYIEISKSNLSFVPPDYIRKQTLANAERFITPELQEYEEKVLTAEEKIMDLEYKIFLEVKSQILTYIEDIQKNASIIATLDVLQSYANTAIKNRYAKPKINNRFSIEIKGGRHPVVEQMTFSRSFVPNDTDLNCAKRQFMLITGPNMSGKSTYLRQVALITLLAHIGSYVPAESADICMTDRIFTRVGASDNLTKGQSTFMVEMQEAANIINNATEKSLIILDEIGRGTSTYDGMSIAWAICEYIHDKIKAKTLFATHYHELISVVERLERGVNYHVTAKEDAEKGIIFLYKILEGGIDKSYGIEVGKLAGLPIEIINKSKQILEDLEEGILEKSIQEHLKKGKTRVPQDQMNLFGIQSTTMASREHGKITHPALEALKKIDINSITPLEALKKLDELKRQAVRK
ncbi:MAG: mismatch repair protein MutS, DNA mismatch repair protein MutS protein [Candidatus Peregrinibacteria bacterium GW2011_GWF2_43_17]|nr:MAG: mismatch repair protein MutS, DNA mismatch repair protein MutS protein [Candidatus Peregrinibacteria bacterium GW2011_GWF2_43_17]